MGQLPSYTLIRVAYTVILTRALFAVWVSQVCVELLVRLGFLTARALARFAFLLQCGFDLAHGLYLDGMIIIIHCPRIVVYGN